MSTSTNGSGNHNRLATELRNQLTSLLSGCLEELDKLARNPEFRSSPTCTNIYQRYDALDAFIGARERIGTEYPQEVASGFYLVLHQNTVASVDSDPHSLELVDADEFEINIAMTRIAQKAEEVHKETLCQIELRLEELGMLQAHRVYPFCLHPSSLYYPFQNAVLPLEIDVQAKVLLCQLFEQRLSPKLLSFYKQINQLLIDHGLLANDKRLRQAIGVRDRVETSTLAPHMRNLPFGGLSTGEFFAPTELRRWDSEAAPASASTTNYEADAPSHIDLIDEDSLTALQWYLNPNFTPKSMGYALGPIIQARPTNRQVVQALSFVQHTNVPDQEPIDAQTIKNKLNDKLAEIKAKTGELAGSQLRITESEEKSSISCIRFLRQSSMMRCYLMLLKHYYSDSRYPSLSSPCSNSPSFRMPITPHAGY